MWLRDISPISDHLTRRLAAVAFISLSAGIAHSAECVLAPTSDWTVEGAEKLSKKKYRENFSGLACSGLLGTDPVCVLVQDENFQAALAALTPRQLTIEGTFDLPEATGNGEYDAEATAFADKLFYVLGSHSRKAKSCDENQDSRALVRFSLNEMTSAPASLEY